MVVQVHFLLPRSMAHVKPVHHAAAPPFPLAPLFPDGVSRRRRADEVPAENPRHEGRTHGGVIGLGPAAGKCWKGLSFGCLVEGLQTAGRLTRVGLDADNIATLL